MKQSGTIKEVAELFHIAPSALRYWDEMGLIRFERGENGYRLPVFQTLMDVSDVLFYRSLSLPVKDIGRLPAMGTAELGDLLRENEGKLLRQLAELEASLERLRAREATLERLETLRGQPLQIVKTALPGIRLFSFEDARTALDYVENPRRAMIMIEPERMEAIFGMAGEGPGSLLRPMDEGERLYLTGLFRSESDFPERHNAARFRQRAESLGYKPGTLVGRYLVSAQEGRRYDYYEGWLELKKG